METHELIPGTSTTCTGTSMRSKASAGPLQEPEKGDTFSGEGETATEIGSFPVGLLSQADDRESTPTNPRSSHGYPCA